MNIVIIGAGGVGSAIAHALARAEYDVMLIDRDPKQLALAATTIDIATKLGSGTDWQLLDDLLDLSPDFFIALTSSDETNLVACAIAKHLGYPRTVARVRDNRFLSSMRLDFGSIFAIDDFIAPEVLVADDILKTVAYPEALAVEYFADGDVQLRTHKIPLDWTYGHLPLSQLDLPSGLMVGLIKRKGAEGDRVIFPHGDDVVLPGDEVTFIGELIAMEQLNAFLGISHRAIESVVIAGGSLIAINLARKLQQQSISVRLLEEDYERCCFLSEQLPETTIIHHSGVDLDFFLAEKVGVSQLFVACAGSDEVNLLSAKLGKQAGCRESIAVLENPNFGQVATEIGIDRVVFSRLGVINAILSRIFSKTVHSLISFYGELVEIVEMDVSVDAKVVGIPLHELGKLLPPDLLIATIKSRGRVMAARGNRILSPGDRAIILTRPAHINQLERLF